jgi:hypothetical protein
MHASCSGGWMSWRGGARCHSSRCDVLAAHLLMYAPHEPTRGCAQHRRGVDRPHSWRGTNVHTVQLGHERLQTCCARQSLAVDMRQHCYNIPVNHSPRCRHGIGQSELRALPAIVCRALTTTSWDTSRLTSAPSSVRQAQRGRSSDPLRLTILLPSCVCAFSHLMQDRLGGGPCTSR